MKTKKNLPLIETNPYLQDPVKRKELIVRSVRSSCGVEGIKVESSVRLKVSQIDIARRPKRIYQDN